METEIGVFFSSRGINGEIVQSVTGGGKRREAGTNI